MTVGRVTITCPLCGRPAVVTIAGTPNRAANTVELSVTGIDHHCPGRERLPVAA